MQLKCETRPDIPRFASDLFPNGYFLDTAQMSVTLEVGTEILVHNISCSGIVDETARHYEHICIVMLPA